MPFFSDIFIISFSIMIQFIIIFFHFIMNPRQNKNAESLQVPVLFPSVIVGLFRKTGKRVLPFISQKTRGAGCQRAAMLSEASMTLETALCFPLFLYFSVALLQPVIWLDRQRRVQAETEIFCERLSEICYLKGLDEEIRPDSRESDTAEEMPAELELLAEVSAALWLKGRVQKHAEGAVIRKVQVPDDENNVVLILSYEETVPFFPAVSGKISMGAAARRRSFTGIFGKLGSKGEDSGNGDEEGLKEVMVYVGASMGRYHWSRDCHYISNQYQAVSASEAEHLRNNVGKRYVPCSRCGKNPGSGTVYITPSGEHYHTRKSCTAMVSYVRSMPLSEVEHLGACSYCERRKGM